MTDESFVPLAPDDSTELASRPTDSTSPPSTESLARPQSSLQTEPRVAEAAPALHEPTESFGDSERDQRALEKLARPTKGSRPNSPQSAASIEQHYTVSGLLGSGSFGRVYRAIHRGLGREVAIKVSHERLAGSDPTTAARALAEAQALAAVRHPNIVTVYNAIEHDGRLLIEMELISGQTLQQWVERSGPISAETAAQIGVKLCGALDALHRRGLIHRDLKPANVMRADNGHIFLVDFGLALRADANGRVWRAERAGTVMLMSPEQFSSDADIDARTDVFGLGVTLYWLVSGCFPIERGPWERVRADLLGGKSAPLRERRSDVPVEFAAIITRATHVKRSERFGSMLEFERALKLWLDSRNAKTRARSRCSQCGHARAGAGRVCSRCGSVVAFDCPKCQGTVEVGARHCPGCGIPVESWGNAESQIHRCQLCSMRGDFVQAREALGAAQRSEPSHPRLAELRVGLEERARVFDAAVRAAVELERHGRLELAREQWARARTAAPESDDVRRAELRMKALAEQEQLAQALAGLERACAASDVTAARDAWALVSARGGDGMDQQVATVRARFDLLERSVADVKFALDDAYKRRDLASFDEQLAALERLGEARPEFLRRESQRLTLKLHSDVVQALADSDVHGALNAARALRKRPGDMPRAERARLERRVVDLRRRKLEQASKELAAILEREGLDAASEWLERLAELRVENAVLTSLQRQLDQARREGARRTFVRTATTALGIAVLGLGVASVLSELKHSSQVSTADMRTALGDLGRLWRDVLATSARDRQPAIDTFRDALARAKRYPEHPLPALQWPRSREERQKHEQQVQDYESWLAELLAARAPDTETSLPARLESPMQVADAPGGGVTVTGPAEPSSASAPAPDVTPVNPAPPVASTESSARELDGKGTRADQAAPVDSPPLESPDAAGPREASGGDDTKSAKPHEGLAVVDVRATIAALFRARSEATPVDPLPEPAPLPSHKRESDQVAPEDPDAAPESKSRHTGDDETLRAREAQRSLSDLVRAGLIAPASFDHVRARASLAMWRSCAESPASETGSASPDLVRELEVAEFEVELLRIASLLTSTRERAGASEFEVLRALEGKSVRDLFARHSVREARDAAQWFVALRDLGEVVFESFAPQPERWALGSAASGSRLPVLVRHRETGIEFDLAGRPTQTEPTTPTEHTNQKAEQREMYYSREFLKFATNTFRPKDPSTTIEYSPLHALALCERFDFCLPTVDEVQWIDSQLLVRVPGDGQLAVKSAAEGAEIIVVSSAGKQQGPTDHRAWIYRFRPVLRVPKRSSAQPSSVVK